MSMKSMTPKSNKFMFNRAVNSSFANKGSKLIPTSRLTSVKMSMGGDYSILNRSNIAKSGLSSHVNQAKNQYGYKIRGIRPGAYQRSQIRMQTTSTETEPVTIDVEEVKDVVEGVLTDPPTEINGTIEDSIAAKLKKESYQRQLDENKVIDPSLKIGTGDDEMVEKIVKTAKTSMGVMGTVIPDQMVSNAVKQKPPIQAQRDNSLETRNFVSKTRDAT